MATTVRIATPEDLGSGAFITPDLVVTAAHVIHPPDEDAPFEARHITVILQDGTELDVVARLCMQRWTDSFDATADMAVVRVDTPRPGDVIAYASNPAANAHAVTVTGYGEAARSGTATRVRDQAGHDSFESDDLAFHDGVSGAPVVAGNGQAIGIATRSPPEPTAGSFIWIPFLDSASETNLPWLIQHCPQEED